MARGRRLVCSGSFLFKFKSIGMLFSVLSRSIYIKASPSDAPGV